MKRTVFVQWVRLVIVIFFVTRSYARLSVKDASLIEQVCQKTPYHDLCVSSLKSDPNSSNADVKGLARFILELFLNAAKDNLVQVKKLLNKATNPAIQQCLNICSNEYDSAVNSWIPLAFEYLESNSIPDAITEVGNASEDAETCEESFGELSRPSPLTAKNNYGGMKDYLACLLCTYKDMKQFISKNCKDEENGLRSMGETCYRRLLCNSVFRKIERQRCKFNRANVKGLALILLELFLNAAKDNLVQVKKLLNRATDPTIQQCLNICSNEYDSAVNSWIPLAFEYLESNSIPDAITEVGNAYGEAETCEESFGELSRPSPLTAENNYVLHLGKIAEGRPLMDPHLQALFSGFANVIASHLRPIISNPNSAGADVKGLARIILELFLDAAKDNLVQVKKLLRGATDPAIQQCLDVCSDEYASAIHVWIPLAFKYLESNSIPDAITEVGNASGDADTCEESFGELSRLSPLTANNNHVLHLDKIADDIMAIPKK
ncbi:hypothetical protein RJ639_045728 [Escallonia herrerae]|uniref:Pectinesterase inhibitor domain-containing protein n=1 Tax=Escallonia herrerae TaxID=1293975 RepID=A0AA88W661_9ASTE|nr:hypothetical protein RJ639_045728 [Escallonia herrerae]